MKNIVKLLNRQKHTELLKIREIKNEINIMVNEFLVFKLPFICKNEGDYLKLSIYYTSLQQKKQMEDSYEILRASWNEVWYDLDYKQKNKFAIEAFNNIKADLKYFYYNDKIIYIAFFDELINALYDHEQAVFELPQFYKLFTDFKSQFHAIDKYNVEPLISGFSNFIYLFNTDEHVYLKSHVSNVVYIVDRNYQCQKIVFEKIEDDDLLIKALKLYDLKQTKAFIELLISSNMINEKTRKKLNKILVKEKYE